MKKLSGILISAAFLFVAAQTSMGFTSTTQLAGFANEAAAIDAAKAKVNQIQSGNYMVTISELDGRCVPMSATNLQATGFETKKLWKNGENGLFESYSATVGYSYNCEEIIGQ
jgi:hypothetical protein